MKIKDAVSEFKSLIENSIIDGGNVAKTAMIRSSRPILNIHEAVKFELILRGINQDLIFPPINSRVAELKLAGELKQKDQDICVIPNNVNKKQERLNRGLLDGTIDLYGIEFTRKSLVINVRSQISSIQKNFDTLFERTYAEAQNLHERCPDIVLGEVYLLAVPEYDDTMFGSHTINFKKINQKLVEKYIKSFKAITDRSNIQGDYYKYESTCLLIVDFNKNIPKIYNTTAELITDGLLPANTSLLYEGLDWANFFDKLLSKYNDRFGIATLTKR